jgi:hypothetical protein
MLSRIWLSCVMAKIYPCRARHLLSTGRKSCTPLKCDSRWAHFHGTHSRFTAVCKELLCWLSNRVADTKTQTDRRKWSAHKLFFSFPETRLNGSYIACERAICTREGIQSGLSIVRFLMLMSLISGPVAFAITLWRIIVIHEELN